MNAVLPPSWDKIRFEEFGGKKDYTALDEQHLSDAIQHLRTFLGEDFPVKSLEERHPLLGYFINESAWTRFWLIEFDQALRQSTKFANVEALANRMRGAGSFHEALSVLECASAFADYGFEIAVEPRNLEPGYQKNPDLLIRNPLLNAEICVEVSTIGESREWRDMMAKYDRISRQLLFASKLAAIGRLKRTPSEPRMRELEQRITRAIELSRELGTMQTLETPEVEIAVGPKSHQAAIREWGLKHGIQHGSFVGPSLDGNLAIRLRTRIREKIAQLPLTRPGLVWIELQTLGLGGEALDYDALEDLLHEHPHIVGVVVTWKMGFLDDLSEHPKPSTRTIVKRKAGGQHIFYRLLENEQATIGVAAGATARIRRALGF